jgi:site-specific recombinase XerD
MNELAVVEKGADWQRLKSLVLDSVSSPITKRVYNLGLDEFFEWYGQEPRPGFTKATVAAWRVALEARGLGAVSINVRITAVRKLAVEAADNGLLAPELANGITRVKGVASKGVRLGNWLTAKQAQALLNAPDATTIKGLRDRAILAMLLGCGLRRSEVAALTFKHIQQRDGRWCIVDLVGKHGRIRTVPMPTWVAFTSEFRLKNNASGNLLLRNVTSRVVTAISTKSPFTPSTPTTVSQGLSHLNSARLAYGCSKMLDSTGLISFWSSNWTGSDGMRVTS